MSTNYLLSMKGQFPNNSLCYFRKPEMAVGYGGTETMAQPVSANRKRVMVGLIVTSFLLVVVAMASGSASSNAPVSLADKIAEVKSLAAEKAVAAPKPAAAAAPLKAEEAKTAAAAPTTAAAAAPKVEAPKPAPKVEAKKDMAKPAPAASKVVVAAKQAKIQHLLDTRRVKLAGENATDASEAAVAAASEDAAPEAAAAAEPHASDEGESKSAEGAEGAGAAGGGAFNSPMGNLNPTGIMSVFFNEKVGTLAPLPFFTLLPRRLYWGDMCAPNSCRQSMHVS